MMPRAKSVVPVNAPLDLEGLHEHAVAIAETFFRQKREVAPQWLLALPDANVMVIESQWDSTPEKDATVALIRNLISRYAVQAAAMISEVWVAQTHAKMTREEAEALLEIANRHGVSALPRDQREEVLIIQSEGRDDSSRFTRFVINRDGRDRASLGLRVDEELGKGHGRMTDLFRAQQSSPTLERLTDAFIRRFDL